MRERARDKGRELYNTSINDMQPLRQQVERYLAETNWDEWQSLPDEFDDANKEDMAKAARKMKAKSYATQDIVEITGLTLEEIGRL